MKEYEEEEQKFQGVGPSINLEPEIAQLIDENFSYG